MLKWHKSRKNSGGWYTNVHHSSTRVELVVITRDYIALTNTTWWTIDGAGQFNGRSTSTLKAAKRLVETYAGGSK